MKKLGGIFLMAVLIYGALIASNPRAGSVDNHSLIANRIGSEGILVLGVSLVIIVGGIDLSIGSVVCLAEICFARLYELGMPLYAAALLVLACAPLIGLFHGLLITKLRLQPFLVTLCGLFIFRGLAARVTWTATSSSARNVGLGDAQKTVPGLQALNDFLFGAGVGGIPGTLLLLLAIAAVLAVLLHGSVYGRYFYAIGANEQAARYAGIPTDRYKILAYMICSWLAALAGILDMLDTNSSSPTIAGTGFELYAITGAVLGGVSLRGGEGMVAGMLLGSAILPLLRSLCRFRGIPDDLHTTVVGAALLVGTIIDELLKRRAARRG
jgi:ribose transport system permease protein